MINDISNSPLENRGQDIIQNKTENTKIELVESLVNEEGRETMDKHWEYLELYQKQNEVAQQLEKRAEENNLKDRDWSKLFFSPELLKFDDDIVVYSAWIPSVQPYLFRMKNWTFEEIPLLPEKIHYDGENGVICRNIRIVKNWVYSVELVHMKNHRVEQRWGRWDVYLWDYTESYFIDKSWKILEQIWQLWDFVKEDGIYSKHNRQYASLWFRQTELSKYDLNWKLQSKSLTIFDKDLHELFTIENSQQYRVQYCDDEICICQDIYSPTKKYTIVDKTWIIAQWTVDELKSNEHMQKFLEREEIRQQKQKENEDKIRETRRLPFGERFKEINHCILSFNEKGDIATIKNDKWETLYEITDVLDFYENDYSPEFRTRNWNLEISERDKDSNILFMKKYEWGYQKKSIFINKTTWEKLELDWFKWIYSSLSWKLIEVFVNWNDSEIYDENLNKLWMRIWSGYWLYAVARQENWDIKTYLYNSNTWKQLFEVDNNINVIKRTYRDEKQQYHLIIQKKDWTLIEVSP